ncbi:MAG: 50S ribosomal protein L28 [Patescibacteria group bacterium]|nr:50S ribosomal protein L28 [Patescibacteria group bacterium]
MARKCEICGKTAKTAISRSHSNIATKRLQKINLQTLIKNGKKYKACAACIRDQAKEKK